MIRCNPRHALLVLCLGIAALVLHAFAGTLHSPRPAAADGTLEICTAQGTLRIDARTLQPVAASAADASDPQRDAAPCCDLCGVSCSVTTADAHPGYRLGNSEPPVLQPAAHHPGHPAAVLGPLVPRGPPARS